MEDYFLAIRERQYLGRLIGFIVYQKRKKNERNSQP